MEKLPRTVVFSVANITAFANGDVQVSLVSVSRNDLTCTDEEARLAWMPEGSLELRIPPDEESWWRARLGKKVGLQPVDL